MLGVTTIHKIQDHSCSRC